MPNALWNYGFPDNYETIVSSSASVKYVSATGSDANNGNTVTTPYLTIAQALSATSGTATSVTIVVLAGTYNISASAVNASFSASCIIDGGKPRLFVCAPGQVIINCTDATGLRDFSPISFSNANSAIYGAILKRNNGARTLSYATSFFNDETSNFKGKAYNTVFQEINANNIWSIQYDNGNDSTAKAYNCTIYTGAAGTGDYSGTTGCVITDTVFNSTYGTSSATFTGCLTSQTVNATTYVTTGVTTKGVYSGTYAWNGTISPPSPGLYSSTSIAYSGSSFTMTLVTTGVTNGTTIPYTVTGVTSAQLSGASLTGNFTVNSNQATVTFTPNINSLTPATFSMASNSYTANVTLSIYLSITTPIIFESIYLTSLYPVNGQLNINHMGGNAISDPTLQPSTAIKTIPSNSYLANKVTVPVLTTTTNTNGPLSVYIVKPMGDVPNREYWM